MRNSNLIGKLQKTKKHVKLVIERNPISYWLASKDLLTCQPSFRWESPIL